MNFFARVFILCILSLNSATFPDKRQRLYTKVVAHDGHLPMTSDIISQHGNVSSLSQCGHACSGLSGCCSIFYNEATKHCLTASSVNQHGLLSSPGYGHFTLRGEVIAEGVCFDNSIYIVGLTKEIWTDAQNICLNKGAKLVVIQNEQENEFIRSLSRDIGETVWIGGTDSTEEGRWTWTESTDAMSFKAWGPNQPNNYNNQDCLSLYMQFDFMWADENCLTTYKYICEKNLQ
ncbi:salivary C-type lectin 2-like [Crassostrea virginica]